MEQVRNVYFLPLANDQDKLDATWNQKNVQGSIMNTYHRHSTHSITLSPPPPGRDRPPPRRARQCANPKDLPSAWALPISRRVPCHVLMANIGPTHVSPCCISPRSSPRRRIPSVCCALPWYLPAAPLNAHAANAAANTARWGTLRVLQRRRVCIREQARAQTRAIDRARETELKHKGATMYRKVSCYNLIN